MPWCIALSNFFSCQSLLLRLFSSSSVRAFGQDTQAAHLPIHKVDTKPLGCRFRLRSSTWDVCCLEFFDLIGNFEEIQFVTSLDANKIGKRANNATIQWILKERFVWSTKSEELIFLLEFNT